MKKIKTGLKLIFHGILSIYLSILLFNYGYIKEISQTIFIFLYFFFIINVLDKIFTKFVKTNKKNYSLIILSMFFAVLSAILCYEKLKLNILEENSIQIIATGTHNVYSNAAEVRISKIFIDEQEINLSELPVSEGWFYKKSEGLICYPQKTENNLKIDLPKAKKIQLQFIKHPWSGIVKVLNDKEENIIDLFDEIGSDYIYEFKGKINNNLLIKAYSLVGGITLFYYLFFISLCLYIKNKRFSVILSILFSSILFYCQSIISINSIIFSIIIILDTIAISTIKRKKIIKKDLILLFLSAIISFLFFGSRLFLILNTITIKNIILFLYIVIWFVPFINLSFLMFDILQNYLKSIPKISKKKKIGIKVCISILLSIILSHTIYQIIFFEEKECTVTIIPSGEKNKNSQGYEILFNSIVIDGLAHQPEEFIELPSGWNNVNGMTIGDGSTGLTLTFPKAKDIKLIFNKHQWSGIVKINDGETNSEIDLFSNNNISYLKSYQVKSNKSYVKSAEIILFMIFILILLCCLLFTIFYFLSYIWNYKVSNKKFFLAIWLEMLVCFSVYITASYPASLCIDSRTQLLQVFGISPITDAHPAIHTLVLKALINLFGSVVGIAIVQAIFFSLVSAVILTYLYSVGINYHFLMLFAAFISLSVNNGIYITTIWKDVPYSIFILLLTYLFYRIGKDKNYLNNPIIIVIFSLSLGGTRLFRHNGIIIYFVGIILLLIFTLIYKKMTYIITILLTILVVSGIHGPLYKIMGVQEIKGVTENVGSMAPLLHGLVYAGIQEELPEDSKKLLIELMPMEQWKNCYRPYCSNELFMSEIAVEYQIEEKIAMIGTSNMLKNYLKTFIYSPKNIIFDRLFGIDLLWNVFRDNGYDWRVANDSYEIGVVSNDMSIYRQDNLFTEILKPIVQETMNNPFLDAIFWRGGFWTVLLIILFFYVIYKKRTYNLFVFLPCIANIISLCLGMVCQDFRYVYFLNLNIPFLILLVLAENKKIEIKKESKARIIKEGNLLVRKKRKS